MGSRRQFRLKDELTENLAEEIPRPEVNVPKAIAAQMGIGFVTALMYLIAIFYATSDLDSVLSGSATFPLAEIYNQATGSSAGTVGLLLIIMLACLCACIGVFITAGRTLYALARDGATPFSRVLGHVNPKWRNPFNATLVCGCICTVLGCIYVGSSTAFNAFVGSFVILTTLSYLAAIGPHILSKRSNIVPGPFWMKGPVGYIANGLSCIYMIVFIVVFCFPYSLPVTPFNMNYSCLTTGGFTVIFSGWWLWIRDRGYRGPRDLGVPMVDTLPRREEKV